MCGGGDNPTLTTSGLRGLAGTVLYPPGIALYSPKLG